MLRRSSACVLVVLGTVALVACGSDFALPTGDDPLDAEAIEGVAAFMDGQGMSVVAPSCFSATFDLGMHAHGDDVLQITVPLAGGFSLTVSTVGGPNSLDVTRIYNSDVLHPDGNVDLQNPPTGGLCPGCEGNMLIIPFVDWPAVGDSPDGGVITLTDFPDQGETTIKSFKAADQEAGEAVLLRIDNVQTGSATPMGNGSVQTVNATETPIVNKAEFELTGSGSIDDIEICHTPPPSGGGLGTGTIGYWKNHPDAWPVAGISIGGVDYPKADAIALMKTPGRGDKTYDLFAQLVAAKLNVIAGNEAICIVETIEDADDWMGLHTIGTNVRARSAAWKSGADDWHEKLTDYNEGKLCAPHRD